MVTGKAEETKLNRNPNPVVRQGGVNMHGDVKYSVFPKLHNM